MTLGLKTDYFVCLLLTIIGQDPGTLKSSVVIRGAGPAVFWRHVPPRLLSTVQALSCLGPPEFVISRHVSPQRQQSS